MKQSTRLRSHINCTRAEFYWQVVWKGTTKLGCAIQKRGRETYIVARYSPPGNDVGTGMFAKNVGRKVHVC